MRSGCDEWGATPERVVMVRSIQWLRVKSEEVRRVAESRRLNGSESDAEYESRVLEIFCDGLSWKVSA